MKMRHARGFTLIELLIVVAIIGIIAAIAVPGLLRARMAANEASAIGSLKAVNTAQLSFAASCGSGFYANSLDGLATPPINGGLAFISPDLGDMVTTKSGYYIYSFPDFTADAREPADGTVACNGVYMISAYWVVANPVVVGSSGQRSFTTSTSTNIYYSPIGADMGPGEFGIPLR